MTLNQAEFEGLLQRLRQQQTESPDIDGKEDLHLKNEGDRAYFVRHVAALANNFKPSYMIIGVEDKTWKAVGLPAESLLHNPDETQLRMNQALRGRVDPRLSVQYRTYAADDVVYGLVAVESTRPPYLIAIDDAQYGGDRTRGKPSYIYRGAIYVRHGASSVAANRQSEVLGIVEDVRQAGAVESKPDSFLESCKYLDVEAEDFGHHGLSERLVEIAGGSIPRSAGALIPAQSWVAFVLYPREAGCTIDTVSLKAKLKPDQRIGRGGNWYQNIPKRVRGMLLKPRATRKEFLGTYRSSAEDEAEGVVQFLRIRPSGHIEFGCTYPLFFEHENVRYFRFVPLIGYLWQMLYFSRAIVSDAGFDGNIGILVNLIGTGGTILDEFASGGRQRWRSHFDAFYPSDWQLAEVCEDPNIQLKDYSLPLVAALDSDIERMIREIATDLGYYYGQDFPRCFNSDTGEFPERQYMSANC